METSDGYFIIDRYLILPLESLLADSNFLVPFLKHLTHFISGKSQLERLLLSEASDTIYYFHTYLRRGRSFNILEKKITNVKLLSKLTSFIEKSDELSDFKVHFKQLCQQEQPQEQIEEKLNDLEGKLSPLMTLNDWSDFGFQGKNPITDLRSTGIASLINLCHLVKYHPKIILEGMKCGYSISFACIGINCTAYLRDLLLSNKLDYHLLLNRNDGNGRDKMFMVNELFASMMLMVEKEWKLQNPPDIMGFPAVFSKVKFDFPNAFL